MFKEIISKIDAKFIRRFGYYIVGFSIGAIGLVFINKQKGNSFDYGMDARTLKQIRLRKEFIITPEAQAELTKNNIDSIRIQYMLHKADVNFSKSHARIKPCPDYWLESELTLEQDNNKIYKNVSFIIKRCDSTATLQKVIVQ